MELYWFWRSYINISVIQPPANNYKNINYWLLCFHRPTHFSIYKGVFISINYYFNTWREWAKFYRILLSRTFHVIATTATGSLYFSSMLVIRFGREVKKIVIRGFVISYEIISFNYSVQRLVYNEYVLVPLSQASSR